MTQNYTNEEYSQELEPEKSEPQENVLTRFWKRQILRCIPQKH